MHIETRSFMLVPGTQWDYDQPTTFKGGQGAFLNRTARLSSRVLVQYEDRGKKRLYTLEAVAKPSLTYLDNITSAVSDQPP